MNRKNLTSAVVAGLAGAAGIASTAQAVNLNPDGLGQVLIYPYYTVNADADGNPNFTVLSVVNTTDHAKAVKVRFLEGENSQEVLDFNLYMSPYDVWTASITDAEDPEDGEMKPHLQTADNSCTVPYLWLLQNGNPALGGPPPLQPQGQKFLPFALLDQDPEDEFDYEPVNPRGREGHFEVIEMGVLTNNDPKAPGLIGSARAATHVAKDEDGDVVSANSAAAVTWEPEDCAQLNTAWFTRGPNPSAYYWGGRSEGASGDPFIDLEAPTGGLFGGAAVVNAISGFMVSYDAKAINGWTSSTTIDGIDEAFATPDQALHQNPGTTLPDLSSGDNAVATVFLDNGVTEAFDFENDSGNPFTKRTVDAVSFLFMHDKVLNEYNQNEFIDGRTEWVMTFPTKNFYVYPPRSDSEDPVAPFTSLWEETDGDWGACERVFLGFREDEKNGYPARPYYDQEERFPDTPVDPEGPVVSPRPPVPEADPFLFELCFETSIIEFVRSDVDEDVPSSVLGSNNVTRINTGDPMRLPPDFAPFGATFDAGWTQILMDVSVDDDGVSIDREPLGSLVGLPVTGFSVNRYGTEGAESGGIQFQARYGGIFQHKGTRLLSSD